MHWETILALIISGLSLIVSITVSLDNRRSKEKSINREYIEALRNSIIAWQYKHNDENFKDIQLKIHSLSRYWNDRGLRSLSDELAQHYNNLMKYPYDADRSIITLDIQKFLNSQFTARKGS
jgi:hypothetical protein